MTQTQQTVPSTLSSNKLRMSSSGMPSKTAPSSQRLAASNVVQASHRSAKSVRTARTAQKPHLKSLRLAAKQKTTTSPSGPSGPSGPSKPARLAAKATQKQVATSSSSPLNTPLTTPLVLSSKSKVSMQSTKSKAKIALIQRAHAIQRRKAEATRLAKLSEKRQSTVQLQQQHQKAAQQKATNIKLKQTLAPAWQRINLLSNQPALQRLAALLNNNKPVTSIQLAAPTSTQLVDYNQASNSVTVAPLAVGLLAVGGLAWGAVSLWLFIWSIMLFVKTGVFQRPNTKEYSFAVATLVLFLVPFPPANLAAFIMACIGIHNMRKKVASSNY